MHPAQTQSRGSQTSPASDEDGKGGCRCAQRRRHRQEPGESTPRSIAVVRKAALEQREGATRSRCHTITSLPSMKYAILSGQRFCRFRRISKCVHQHWRRRCGRDDTVSRVTGLHAYIYCGTTSTKFKTQRIGASIRASATTREGCKRSYHMAEACYYERTSVQIFMQGTRSCRKLLVQRPKEFIHYCTRRSRGMSG